MAMRTQNELMIYRVQFIRRTNEAASMATCTRNTREDIVQNMETHNSITGEVITRIICLDLVTTLLLLFRISN